MTQPAKKSRSQFTLFFAFVAHMGSTHIFDYFAFGPADPFSAWAETGFPKRATEKGTRGLCEEHQGFRFRWMVSIQFFLLPETMYSKRSTMDMQWDGMRVLPPAIADSILHFLHDRGFVSSMYE